MRIALALALSFAVATAANAERASHPDRGFSVAARSGWRAIAEGSHLDLLRDSAIIHIYPSAMPFLTVESVHEDIASYFEGKGGVAGESRPITVSGKWTGLWTRLSGVDNVLVGGALISGQAFFIRAEVDEATPSDLEEAFLEALGSLLPAGGIDIPLNKARRVDVLSTSELSTLDRALYAYADAFSLVEIVDAAARVLDKGYFGDPEFALFESETEGAIDEEIARGCRQILEADHLTRYMSQNLDSAIASAAPNRTMLRIAEKIVLELETARSSITKARSELREARAASAAAYPAATMEWLAKYFDGVSEKLDAFDGRITRELLPKARRLVEKTTP